jgi:pterin-4a-carbinolamine dehydratase
MKHEEEMHQGVETPAGRPPVLRLRPERVQEGLAALPGWKLLGNGRSIHRVRQFKDPLHAEAFAVLVARLTAAENQPATIDLSPLQVMVSLHGPAAGGCIGELTERSLDLASVIG